MMHLKASVYLLAVSVDLIKYDFIPQILSYDFRATELQQDYN